MQIDNININVFPEEIKLQILSNLDPLTLKKMALVSKEWNRLTSDDLLWKNMNVRFYPESFVQGSSEKDISWKQKFKDSYLYQKEKNKILKSISPRQIYDNCSLDVKNRIDQDKVFFSECIRKFCFFYDVDQLSLLVETGIRSADELHLYLWQLDRTKKFCFVDV